MAGLTAVEIAGVFNTRIGPVHGARLLGGAPEPEYLPADRSRPALIRYTRDYARSALHELAHWCIAGAERRQRPDYGYWYQPPPRSDAQLATFARVECRAQALELLLAEAAGVPFRVSVDDVAAQARFEPVFARQVQAAAAELRGRGLRGRARLLRDALAAASAAAPAPGAPASAAPFSSECQADG